MFNRLEFLLAKEAALKAEVEQMMNTGGLTSEDVMVDRQLQVSEASEETWRGIRETESIIDDLQVALSGDRDLIEKENILLRERQELGFALQRRLDKMTPVPDTPDRVALRHRSLEQSIDEAQESNTVFMQQLSEF